MPVPSRVWRPVVAAVGEKPPRRVVSVLRLRRELKVGVGEGMKITINLDVTPQEARTFFGLPDVKPLQDEMLGKVREKILSGAEGFDPVSLLKPFFPQNVQTLEAIQKSFWQALAGKTGGTEEQAPPRETVQEAKAREAKASDTPAKPRTRAN